MTLKFVSFHTMSKQNYKIYVTSQKHSWKYSTYQYMINGSHRPGQQFSLSLVEAKMAVADSLCPKVVKSFSRGGFNAEMI